MLAGEYTVLRPGGQALTMAVLPLHELCCRPGRRRLWLDHRGQPYDLDYLCSRSGPLPRAAALPATLLRVARRLGLAPRPAEEAGVFFLQQKELPVGAWAIFSPVQAPPLSCMPSLPGAPPQAPSPAPGLPPSLQLSPPVGRSAALCSAFALALLGPARRAEAFSLAFLGHREFQGGGSGYDVAACFCGGTSLFKNVPLEGGTLPVLEDVVTPVNLPERLQVAALFSGVKARTGPLLARLDGNPAAQALLDRSAAQNNRLVRCLLGPAVNPGELRDAVEAAMPAFRELDRLLGGALLPDCLNAALQQLEAAGYSAKVSGAGGGDYGVGFRLRN